VSGATKIWLLPAHPHEFGTNYNKTVIRTVFAQNNFGSREAVYKRSQRKSPIKLAFNVIGYLGFNLGLLRIVLVCTVDERT